MNYADQESIVNIQDLLVATKATKKVPGEIHYEDELYYLVLEYRERCISVRYSNKQARDNAYDGVAALLTQRATDGFTAEQIAQIRRIANDVLVGATE